MSKCLKKRDILVLAAIQWYDISLISAGNVLQITTSFFKDIILLPD